MRRIYLDAVGRIPTAEEAAAFLADKAPDKRAKLVDKLLHSPGYTMHMYNWMGDMLRLKDTFGKGVPAFTFQDSLKDQLHAVRPWDSLVRTMLTAEGKLCDNGATGFLLYDAQMPLDGVSSLLTTFLGAIAVTPAADFSIRPNRSGYDPTPNTAAVFADELSLRGRRDFAPVGEMCGKRLFRIALGEIHEGDRLPARGLRLEDRQKLDRHDIVFFTERGLLAHLGLVRTEPILERGSRGQFRRCLLDPVRGVFRERLGVRFPIAIWRRGLSRLAHRMHQEERRRFAQRFLRASGSPCVL